MNNNKTISDYTVNKITGLYLGSFSLFLGLVLFNINYFRYDNNYYSTVSGIVFGGSFATTGLYTIFYNAFTY